MYDKFIHSYEKLPLCNIGLIMGCILLALHLYALAKPTLCRKWLAELPGEEFVAQLLLTLDFGWVFLLLYGAQWNPLRINLFDFEPARGMLLLLCPVIWFVLVSMVKENLLGRALGMFLLLLVMLPLSAAFLKAPLTRLLIPIWCYPVLTLALFWVAKPYLFRDWMAALAARPKLYTAFNIFGAAYGAAILLCAVLFW